MKRALLLLAALPAAAQSNYVGLGAGYNGGTTPNLNVTFTYATLIAKSSPALWSYTSGDYVSARTHPFSVKPSLRTGLLMVIRNWKYVMIGEMFNAGATGGTTGGILPSIGVGGLVMFKLPNSFTVSVDVHEAAAIQPNGTSWTVQSVLLLGHVW